VFVCATVPCLPCLACRRGPSRGPSCPYAAPPTSGLLALRPFNGACQVATARSLVFAVLGSRREERLPMGSDCEWEALDGICPDITILDDAIPCAGVRDGAIAMEWKASLPCRRMDLIHHSRRRMGSVTSLNFSSASDSAGAQDPARRKATANCHSWLLFQITHCFGALHQTSNQLDPSLFSHKYYKRVLLAT